MINIKRGDTVTIAANLYVDNVPFSPSEGEHVVFSVKKKIDDNEPVLLQKELVGNEVKLSHEDTCSLDCGLYVYDIRIYTEDKSTVYTPLVDQLKICEVVNCEL